MFFKNLHLLVLWIKVVLALEGLTLRMLRLLFSKAKGRKDFWKSFKPCHVDIHLIALAEYSQMSTHMLGFQSYLRFFASFCIGQIRHQQHKGYVRKYWENTILGTLISHIWVWFSPFIVSNRSMIIESKKAQNNFWFFGELTLPMLRLL